MSVSPEELLIIAKDGHGLLPADREAIREAANNIEHAVQSYFTMRAENCELRQQVEAQGERLREQGDRIKDLWVENTRLRRIASGQPSWARF